MPKRHDGWMWDLTVPGDNDHDFYVSAGSAPVLVHNTSCPTSGTPWKLTKAGSSEMKQGGPFNTTFYRSASAGTWWTPDVTGHAKVAFKVYEQNNKGLQWIYDATANGDYIQGKWKGKTGYFIPWSQLRGAG